MKLIYRKHLKIPALIWIGCFALFLFVYILVLAPQKKAQKNIEKQLTEIKQIYDSTKEAALQKTQIQMKEQIEQLRNRLNDFVIESDDSANLTLDISQIASEKKLDSFMIKTRESRENPAITACKHITEDRIDIGFNAGFNQFAAFLNALERHQPVVFIDTFSITRSKQDNSGHKVNMNLAVFAKKWQEKS
jgi:Tfp pilus assembly protein PilO